MKTRPESRTTTFVRRPIEIAYAVAGVALLIVCGLIVDPQRAPDIEREIFYFLNGIPDFVYWPLWVLMQIGNLVAIPVAALVAAGFKKFRLAIAILVAGGAKLVVARVIKDIFLRERPAAVIDDVIRRGDASASGQAFVSGHAIIAFALATLIHPYLGRTGRIVLWSLAVAVCLGRIYVGAHLPLDVVGGAAVGWAIGSLLNLALGKPAPRATAPERSSEAVAG